MKSIEHLLYGLVDLEAIADKLLPKEKPVKKCLLPNCNNLTDHNKGYCCADHYKSHHKQLKEKFNG